MTQRDRSSQERAQHDPRARDTRAGERPPASGNRRHDPEDDESFDLPSWSGSSSRSASNDPYDDYDASLTRDPRRESRSQRPRADPMPRLGDAFARGGRRVEYPDEEPSTPSTRDPYDRLRRVANKPQRPVSFDDEPGFVDGPADYPDLPPVPRERGRSRRPASSAPAATRSERAAPARPAPSRQLGGAIAAASPHMRFLASIGGVALLSLMLMAASVAGRIGSLPDWVVIHVNAEGTPDRFGTPATLWRVPLMATMLTVMSATVAFFLAKRDPFASRFALTSTLIIHALAWIALIHLLWQ